MALSWSSSNLILQIKLKIQNASSNASLPEHIKNLKFIETSRTGLLLTKHSLWIDYRIQAIIVSINFAYVSKFKCFGRNWKKVSFLEIFLPIISFYSISYTFATHQKSAWNPPVGRDPLVSKRWFCLSTLVWSDYYSINYFLSKWTIFVFCFLFLYFCY